MRSFFLLFLCLLERQKRMDTKEQEDIDNVAFNTFIGVLVSICGNVNI
jgi:hypothetical protein